MAGSGPAGAQRLDRHDTMRYRPAMFGHVGSTGLALLSLGAAAAAIAAEPVPVQCNAIGAKVFAPAMTATDVCIRFSHALRAVPVATTPHDGLVVELRFLPRGMASAKVTQIRAGLAKQLPVYELAISDRQFMASDIDSLAGDVARGLKAVAPDKGKHG